ncbi:hypothetical protein [Demequina aestuarii]|uniref:hypothetical protein n=1 Tax=Demequina aestuarii TaxID=327095 RepID=UPI0007856A93|nr:hypothetical protein [Demequina aestuarii]
MHLSKRFTSAAGIAAGLVSLIGLGVGASVAGASPSPSPTPEVTASAAPVASPSPTASPALESALAARASGVLADDATMTVVLESVHAPGKAATIADATWPLESRTIGADATTLSGQVIHLHALDGEADTFVLADSAGRVLARVDGSRSLEVLDLPVTEAAALPRATWIVTSNGSASKVVNGEPLDGVDQALDLYDWSTAEGARIATYDDNDYGTNQSWRVHTPVAVADAVGELVAPGAAPLVPDAITGRYGWGATVELAGIDWDLPSASAWQSDGVVAFTGTATGLLGEEVVVEAEYTVGTVGDAVPATIDSFAGVRVESLRLDAPTQVQRRISGSSMTVTADVAWDWDALTPAMLANPGTVTVHAVADLGFAATLEITLSEPARSNVLRDTNVRGWSFSASDPRPGLTDGDLTAEGFGDWRAGGAANRINPNWVAFYFDQPRQLDAAAIYEMSSADNIGAVTFQYRTMGGGWVDTSAGTVQNTGGRLVLETDFDAVLATGFRAVIEHKSDASWMQLAELEAWGPVAP